MLRHSSACSLPHCSQPPSLPCAMQTCTLFLPLKHTLFQDFHTERCCITTTAWTATFSICSLFLFHHNSSMGSLLSLTPPAPRCILPLRSWHCGCHCGKKSTALASLCLGFTPGWSGKKSIPWMMNWFGLSEERTFPMDLSLVSSIPA